LSAITSPLSRST